MSRREINAVTTKDAFTPERTFQTGQTIRWNPPVGVYGPKCLQTLMAGKTGTVTRIWNDSYLLACIGGRNDVLLNQDFVEAA